MNCEEHYLVAFNVHDFKLQILWNNISTSVPLPELRFRRLCRYFSFQRKVQQCAKPNICILPLTFLFLIELTTVHSICS